MNLQIVGLQTHDDKSPLAFTVMFDDLDRGRRMVATVSEAALIDSAAHPDCEAIDVGPMTNGTVHSEQYDTAALVRVIKKFIRDKANRENPNS
jgi:hypothetical protein